MTRREQEIEEKKTALEDLKRKNQLVQDKVQEQIKTLTMKLEELRVEHQTNEASSDSIISCLQDKLIQVREPSQGLSISLLLTNQSDDKFLPSEFLAFTFLRPKSV